MVAVAANCYPQTPERWNLFYQATSIGQNHGSFFSLYEGPNSLSPLPENRVSLTTTLFFGLRLATNTQFYFDPEVAGGKGFSDVTGIANFPNGEIPRVDTATPKPYLARLYVTQDFGFGSEKEQFSSDENQLAGERPLIRYSVTVGRFTVTDFFDNNRYSHEPRTQFMGWAVMYNGAWDYPADVHGYTWGWVHEFHARNWSVRYGNAAEPRVANGLRFDHRLLRNHANLFEGEVRYNLRTHPGAVRLLGFMHYTNSGTYADAIRLGEQTGTTPDITATRRNGTLKYGSGLNFEQEISKDFGVFGRLGWNDGKTETFAFTAIDRLASFGLSVHGNALEAQGRYRGQCVHGERAVGRPRAVSRAGRSRLHHRRWRVALRHGEGLGKLLQRAPDGGLLCDNRCTAGCESGVQPGSRSAVGGLAAPSPGAEQGSILEANEALRRTRAKLLFC